MATRKLLTAPTSILNFPALKEPSAFKGKGDKTYNAKFIFDVKSFSQKDTDRFNALRKEAMSRFIKRHGADAVVDRDNFIVDEDYNWPFRKEKVKKGQKPRFPKGAIIISAKTQFQPSIGKLQRVDGKVKPVSTDDYDLFYSGAIVRAKLSIYDYSGGGNEGVGFNLDSVLFLTHGEPLGGGGVSAEAAFEDEDFDEYSKALDEDLEVDEDEDEDEDEL